jgi:hypothetical protein
MGLSRIAVQAVSPKRLEALLPLPHGLSLKPFGVAALPPFAGRDTGRAMSQENVEVVRELAGAWKPGRPRRLARCLGRGGRVLSLALSARGPPWSSTHASTRTPAKRSKPWGCGSNRKHCRQRRRMHEVRPEKSRISRKDRKRRLDPHLGERSAVLPFGQDGSAPKESLRASKGSDCASDQFAPVA